MRQSHLITLSARCTGQTATSAPRGDPFGLPDAKAFAGDLVAAPRRKGNYVQQG
jgi:hypothetical protein